MHIDSCGPADDLDRCFTLLSHRTVSKTLSVQYRNALYQILTPRRRLRYAAVQLRENEAGDVSIEYNGRTLPYQLVPTALRQPVADRKQLHAVLAHASKAHIPPADHPWRHYRKPSRKLLLPDYLRDISTWEREDICAQG